MSSLYNRARVSTATAGTGTITLGAVTSNAFFTFAEAGVPDGTVVSYVIEDGSNVEVGVGTYTTAGTTLTRTVTASKIAGVAGTTKLTLSGSAIVYIDALAADITVPPASSTDNAIVRFDGTTGRTVQNSVVTIEDAGNAHFPFQAGTGAGFWLGDATPAVDRFFFGSDASVADTFRVFSLLAGVNVIQVVSNATPASVIMTLPGQLTTNSLVTLATTASSGSTSGSAIIGGGIGISGKINAALDSAATATITQMLRLTSTSTGTPANGIGVGQEFEVETAAGNNEIGATIEAYAWDVTSTSEDFDLVFKTMSAGAAATEKGRTGFMPVNMIQNDSMTLLASNSIVVSTQYTIPTGLTLTMAANSVMRIL